jgi:subtilisin family serine protease
MGIYNLLLSLPLIFYSFTGITPPLQEIIGKSAPDELIPVNLIMKDQVDYKSLREEVQSLPTEERRRIVIETAKNKVLETQGTILNFLKSMEKEGKVKDIRILFLINGINFKATKDVILELHQRFPEIRSLDWDEPIKLEEVLDIPPKDLERLRREMLGKVEPPPPDDIAWGVVRINAPLVWNMGYTGQGVIIANIDTGVNYYHVDLNDHIWVNPGEDIDGDGVVWDSDDLNGIDDDGNGYVDDLIGWDFYSNDNNPIDSDGHGSNTAGIMVGDGTAGQQTGVAPDALLMCIRQGGSESNWWLANEYAVMNGAHVISSSMSLKFGWHQPDYASWRQLMEATLAAGVIRANSIGNQGDQQGTHPIPWNIACPGNVPPPWLHPDQTLIGGVAAVMGCGAVDENDVIKYYSGRGPSAWEDINAYYPSYPHPIPPEYWDYPYDNGNYMGLLKPDVCAPTDVPTIDPFNNYGYDPSFGGTSAATPHLGGAMALLKSINPSVVSPELISEALQMTAVDLGSPGKDNTYGAGRIDVYEAALYVLTHMGDPGDPMPPESLSAYSDYTTPSQIHLSWMDPTTYFSGDPLNGDLAGIRIYNADDSTFIASVGAGVEEYWVSGLTDGVFYRFYLVAYTIDDSTSPPSQVAGWYAGGHPVPSSPTNLSAYSDSTMPTSVLITWNDPTTQVDGTPLDDLDHINIYDADADTLVTQVPAGVEQVLISGLIEGLLYRFYATAVDNESPPNESSPSNVDAAIPGGEPGGDYLVYDPDPDHSSGPIIDSLLSSLGFLGVYTTNLSSYLDFLSNFSSLWVTVGIYPNNFILDNGSPEAQAIAQYIQNGGNCYLEGGDVWYWDPLYAGGYNFGPLFGISPASDGTSDLGPVQGLSGTFTESMYFNYSGENNYIDHIDPTSGAFQIFRNVSPVYSCGVAYDQGNYRTVGTSFELGGLVDGSGISRRDTLIKRIMDFFGVLSFIPGDVNGDGLINPADLSYLSNYLFFAGPEPIPLLAGDSNGDCIVNGADLSYLANYIFFGGPAPQSCTGFSYKTPGKIGIEKRSRTLKKVFKIQMESR